MSAQAPPTVDDRHSEDLTSQTSEGTQRDNAMTPTHQYHAEAHGLSGYFHHPVYQRINEQALVNLYDDRDGHIVEQERDFDLERVVSFRAAHSRVSGSRSLKNRGWVTLSTSIVEGLNVLEVITADRVISQVSTDHAYENGHVPTVTFLGSQFVNLRLTGFEIQPRFNYGICGPRPSGHDIPYVQDRSLLEAAGQQAGRVADGFAAVIAEIGQEPIGQNGAFSRAERSILSRNQTLLNNLRQRYSDRRNAIAQLLTALGESSASPSGNPVNGGSNGTTVVTCSLIHDIDIDDLRDVIPGLRTVGNVLFVPDFGAVTFGEIDVSSTPYLNNARVRTTDNYFRLRMIEMDLGCVGDGKVITAQAAANGRHNP
jgi:hypothetical protein